jgi:hypothetical protein
MLARLDRRIEREILRLRVRYKLSLDEFRGLYVSDEHVDSLVSAAHGTGAFPERDDESPLAEGLEHLDARWAALCTTFTLDALEQDLLLLALALELDLKYETLYAYLNNDITRKWPTADLAQRLLSCGDDYAPGDCARALAPRAKLREQRLIDTIEPPGTRPSSLNLAFVLNPTVARHLLAGAGAGEPLVADTSADWSALPFSSEQTNRLRGLVRVVRREPVSSPAIVLVGEAGCDRGLAARVLARELQLPCRELDLARARRSGLTPLAALEQMTLELRLSPAALCVRGFESLCDQEGHAHPELRRLLDEPSLLATPLVLIVEGGFSWREVLGTRRALVLDLGLPDYQERRALWTKALAAVAIDCEPADCAFLASRFRLAPAQIRDAVATALDWAMVSGDSQPGVALLAEAARAQSHERLGQLASKVRLTHDWEDLVLAGATVSRLRELCEAIRCRELVYADWGFAQRFPTGIGIKALFAGGSGTGKTMAASVIARRLGLDLYKIDLAGLVSKYIGETEKNLDRIFAAARASNAILFFDEADALFGKRSEVKDAHDRYANVEVAYLLQKLEDHDGVVILASNLKRNIDDAFARRLHYVVDFPQPDAAQREQLWRGMFPTQAPREPDIDYAFLARQFELAGGDIRNVVLDAAFLSANAGKRIGMPQLVQALSRQMTKQGKTAVLSDFQRYYPLLHATNGAAVQAASRASGAVHG